MVRCSPSACCSRSSSAAIAATRRTGSSRRTPSAHGTPARTCASCSPRAISSSTSTRCSTSATTRASPSASWGGSTRCPSCRPPWPDRVRPGQRGCHTELVEGRAEAQRQQRQLKLPEELSTRRLVRRALWVVALLVLIGLIAAFAPGLGEVRDRLKDARPGWLAVAVVLEALSGVSYVAMFRPVFCPGMSWRTSWEIGWSELAVGSLVPASGAGGLALGAWILTQGGMPAGKGARRAGAFFLIKSSVNFVAVAVIGTLMALGVAGPRKSLLLTALPAVLSLLTIAAVVLLPRIGRGPDEAEGDGRVERAVVAVRHAVVDGA